MMPPVVTATWCGGQEVMEAVKLLMPAPNLGTGKLWTSGSPAFNQSSLCLAVSGASVAPPRATQRGGPAATFALRPLGLHFLHCTCQRHSTKSVPWLLFPSTEQPFYSQGSLWWLLSLRCLLHVAAEGHTGCTFVPLLFPSRAVQPRAGFYLHSDNTNGLGAGTSICHLQKAHGCHVNAWSLL